MRILAIETSGRYGTIAAVEESDGEPQTVRSLALSTEQRSAQSLVPAIQSMLEDCQWQPQQLDLICVASGPGSFTGLRIGVTTAKTLAYATEAKLAEVSTLAAIAAGNADQKAKLWTILDAQRQELFVTEFAPNWETQSEPQHETRLLSVENWLQELQPGDQVSGPPLKKLINRLPDGVIATDEQTWSPQAEVVARLGLLEYQHDRCIDPMQLVPRYFRKSAAEEKAERQAAG